MAELTFKEKIRLQVIDEATRETAKIKRGISRDFLAMHQSSQNVANGFKRVQQNIISTQTAIIGMSAYISGRFVKSFLNASSEVENLETEFKVLLKSADDARGRIKELAKFAESTPFEMKQVAQASKILETFTKGALSTGDALRTVGDAAAITAEKDFANLAMWVGRAYDGLQNNRPVGEAMMRLQELALVSGEARGQIEKLQKEAKGKEAWNVLWSELQKAKGGMVELSETATGLESTIRDQLKSAMRQFMDAGAWDAYKNTLVTIRSTMDDMIKDGAFQKLAEHTKTLIGVGKGLLAVWSAKKFMDIAAAIRANYLATATLTKTTVGYTTVTTRATAANWAMQRSWIALKAASPLIAVTALSAGIEALVSSYEKAVERMSGTDEISNPETVKNAIDIAKKYQEELSKGGPEEESSGFMGSKVELTEHGKILADLRSEWAEMSQLANIYKLDNANTVTDLQAQLKGLQKISVHKEKIQKLKSPSAPSTPSSPTSSTNSVSNEYADPFQEARAHAEAQRLILEIQREAKSEQLAIEEIYIQAQAEGQDKSLALLENRYQQELLAHHDNEAMKAAITKQYEFQQQKIRQAGMAQNKAVADQQKTLALNSLSQSINTFKVLASENKKHSELYQAAAHSQNIIDTYASATASYKSLAGIPYVGPVLGGIAAAAAVASGLANAQKIQSQKFHGGGREIQGYGNRERQLTVQAGEMVDVYSRQQVNQRRNAPPVVMHFHQTFTGPIDNPQETGEQIAQTATEKMRAFMDTQREAEQYR